MRVFAASLAEMWSSARKRNRLSSDEATAELLLARRQLGRHEPASQRTLELVLAAAAGPATERELAGETAAVTAFLAALPEPEPARRRGARRLPVLVVAFVLVALVALCGTAEAGALPAPLQRLAHQAINAPAPSPAMRFPRPSADVTPGPGATGSRSAPGSFGPSQESPTGKPSANPKPTHTSDSQGNGNGQPTASDSAQPTASDSAQPTATDNGKGNGGTPGQGGNPGDHPTKNNGNGNGNSQN
jgi:hypothetical protein